MEDNDIVELFLARNEDAISKAAEKYGSRIRQIAYGILSDYGSAEECENDTYHKAWESIPPNEPRKHLFAYLGRIVRNIALNRLKADTRKKRSASCVELTKEMMESIPSGVNLEADVLYEELKQHSKANIPMSSWQSVFIALHTAMGTTNSNGTNDSAVAPAYQSVLSSYGYNSASASIQYSASWSQVTSAINANAVHLILHDSEIYANHSVVGLGYVSFSHSTGWVSKYYKIVDGWTADIRYVHSSLGIGSINLVTVYVGS